MVEESTTINATVQEVRDDLIPKLFWSSLEMCPLNSRELDWVSGDFTFKDYSGFFDCEGVAFNVHFEVANLPGLAANDGPEKVEAALIPAEPSAPPSARGRPAKWDWEGALAHLVTIANGIDGLEALATDELRQADVERAICDWFISKVGEAPVESEIRKRAAKVTLALSEAEKSRLAK